MENDGVKLGYDLNHLAELKKLITIPLIASGGAGKKEHFKDLFVRTGTDGALAASVFHSGQIFIPYLKKYLNQKDIKVRI